MFCSTDEANEVELETGRGLPTVLFGCCVSIFTPFCQPLVSSFLRIQSALTFAEWHRFEIEVTFDP